MTNNGHKLSTRDIALIALRQAWITSYQVLHIVSRLEEQDGIINFDEDIAASDDFANEELEAFLEKYVSDEDRVRLEELRQLMYSFFDERTIYWGQQKEKE